MRSESDYNYIVIMEKTLRLLELLKTPQSFEELRKSGTFKSPPFLSLRLKQLMSMGLVQKYDGSTKYILTEKGEKALKKAKELKEILLPP